MCVIDQLKSLHTGSLAKLKKSFIEWLRAKLITCWDTQAKEFDTQLIHSTHLIRSELSRNKKGFKTFIGYTYRDLSFVPYVCTEENPFYPSVGKVKLSKPANFTSIVEEYLEDVHASKQKKEVSRKNKSLSDWGFQMKRGLRPLVKRILSTNKLVDGRKRALFILSCELRNTVGDTEAMNQITNWSNSLPDPIPQLTIEQTFKSKVYRLPDTYIQRFLEEMKL